MQPKQFLCLAPLIGAQDTSSRQALDWVEMAPTTAGNNDRVPTRTTRFGDGGLQTPAIECPGHADHIVSSTAQSIHFGDEIVEALIDLRTTLCHRFDLCQDFTHTTKEGCARLFYVGQIPLQRRTIDVVVFAPILSFSVHGSAAGPHQPSLEKPVSMAQLLKILRVTTTAVGFGDRPSTSVLMGVIGAPRWRNRPKIGSYDPALGAVLVIIGDKR